MAHRELELTLLSARDLKSVNLFTRMDVYAVASISGDPMTRQSTPTDTFGGRNPSWNATMRFNVPPSAAAAGANGGGWLHVLLRSERALGDRDVGEVVVPLAELLAGADGPGPQPPRVASYQVHTVLRCEPRGVLNVSYRLGPVVAPVTERDAAKSPTIITGYPVAAAQPFKPQHRPQQKYQYDYEYEYSPPRDAYAPTYNYKHQNPQQPYQYSPPRNTYAPPAQTYRKPQSPAPPPSRYQYSPPRDAYQQTPPTKPQSPAPPRYQYSPPRDSYQQTPPKKPQSPATPRYQYSPPRDSYRPPPTPPRRQEEAPPAPANGKSNGHAEPNQVYMGPHTQIIFNSGGAPTPWMPQAADNGPTKPKPYYAPSQPNNTISAKEDAPKPNYAPSQATNTIQPAKEPTKPYYAPSQPNNTITPAKEDGPKTKPNYAAPAQPNNNTITPAKEDGPKSKPYYAAPAQPNNTTSQAKQDEPKPKPYYAPSQPKEKSPAKTDHYDQTRPNASSHKPGHSTRTQHEIKVTEQTHHTQTKTGPVKTDHSTRPQQQQAVQKQEDYKQQITRISSSRKADGTRVEPTATQQSNNIQLPASKTADSTRPKEASSHATNRSSSTPPGNADLQSAHKTALQQYERVHSLQTAAAR